MPDLEELVDGSGNYGLHVLLLNRLEPQMTPMIRLSQRYTEASIVRERGTKDARMVVAQIVEQCLSPSFFDFVAMASTVRN